jgi:hypothetical protein
MKTRKGIKPQLKQIKPSKSKIRALHKKAWNIFSKALRKSKSDWRGCAPCYTCGKQYEWQLLQAGHYWHGKLDFDVRNIHPQCVRCNKWLHGNLDNYSMKLIDELGLEEVKQLRRDAARHPGYTYSELKDIHAKYLKLFDML